MTEGLNSSKTLTRQIIGGIVIATCSAVLGWAASLSSSNTARDVKLVELQTTVKDMNERLTKEHEGYVQQLATIESQLRQVQIDTARISEKVGVYASPGVK